MKSKLANSNNISVSFKVSEKDFQLIRQIADRAIKEIPDYPDKKLALIMDLSACHANGNPLRLYELLIAESKDFFHDVLGIRTHINRETGRLENHFLPRHHGR